MIPVVYVAGPFRGPDAWTIETNVRTAEIVSREVLAAGAMPLCPHANTRYFHGLAPDAFFLAGTLELLRRCDAIVLGPGWRLSEGSKGEFACAMTLGLPCFEATDVSIAREFYFWVEAVLALPEGASPRYAKTSIRRVFLGAARRGAAEPGCVGCPRPCPTGTEPNENLCPPALPEVQPPVEIRAEKAQFTTAEMRARIDAIKQAAGKSIILDAEADDAPDVSLRDFVKGKDKAPAAVPEPKDVLCVRLAGADSCPTDRSECKLHLDGGCRPETWTKKGTP